MKSRRDRLRVDSERGAVLLLSAALMVAIIGTAAVVVDLASARNDRSENKLGADAAATAGAHALTEGTGQDACETALAYLQLNIAEPIGGASCGGFPTTCSAATPSASTIGTTADGTTATIRYPVNDGDEMMGVSVVGDPTQGASAQDGDRCFRFGVSIEETRNVFFGGVAGPEERATFVHSVAIARNAGVSSKMINLLVLHETDCASIATNGGGTVIVSAVLDGNGDLQPGLLASDSNGTTNCGSNGVIDVDGGGTIVRADGAPGCANELPSGPGAGCGLIETFVPGLTQCEFPVCSGGGLIAPNPAPAPFRLTRAQVDYAFNCKLSYPASYGVERCPDAGPSTNYIDTLSNGIGSSGRPAGYDDYRGAGYKCTYGPAGAPVIIPPGNWWVDCNNLSIKRDVTFEGGNIVFDGDVSVGSDGLLSINTANPENYPWFAGSPASLQQHSAGAAFIYFRNGTFSRNAQGSVVLHNTVAYLSPTSALDMGGGGGSMSWTAPTEGPFQNLALWSESPTAVEFAGGSSLDLEGVFFAPFATVSYQGSGNQEQIAAQFIALKLSAGGGGSLNIAPLYNRSILFPRPKYSELIR